MTMWVLTCAVLLSASLSSASAQDSILVELLGSKYDGLVNLFEHADLLGTLEKEVAASPGGVTIFAPTDYHLMHRVSPNVLTFLKQEKNVALLRKTLLNHVTIGKVDATAWSPVKTVKTLAGSVSELFLDGGELRVDGAVVRELNVLEAGDGVVHAINGFLLPRDVEDAIALDALQFKDVVESVIDRRMAMSSAPMGAPMMPMGSAPMASTAYAPAPAGSPAAALLATLNAVGDKKLITLLQMVNYLPRLDSLIAQYGAVTFLAPTASALNLTKVDSLGMANIVKVLQYNTIIGSYTYAQLKAIGSGGVAAAPAPSAVHGHHSMKVANATGGSVQTALGVPLQVTTVGDNVFLGPYPPGVLLQPTALSNSTTLQVDSVNGLIMPPSALLAPTLAPKLAPAPAPNAGAPVSASSRSVVSVGVLAAALAAACASLLV